MLKMFHQHESAGSTSAYWESMWGVLNPISYAIEARRHCEGTPIWNLVTRTIQRDRLFIDGGCGHGYWVKCLHDRGQKAAGIDFANRTLDQIRRIDPGLDIRLGDVRALPFRDGEVHVYYSGGVVEHFEDGPVSALNEARRVIADDGWFLCSVPDVSPLRKNVLYRAATETHSVRNGPLVVRRASGTRVDPTDASVRFYQYVFAEDEFRGLLNAAGFDVVETFGESFLWGLLEIDPLRRFFDGAMHTWRTIRRGGGGRDHHERAVAIPDPQEAAAEHAPQASLRALSRRILLNEDRTIPVIGGAIGLVAELAANLRMYVARPSSLAARRLPSSARTPPRSSPGKPILLC